VKPIVSIFTITVSAFLVNFGYSAHH